MSGIHTLFQTVVLGFKFHDQNCVCAAAEDGSPVTYDARCVYMREAVIKHLAHCADTYDKYLAGKP